jgi:hypothetical protein
MYQKSKGENKMKEVIKYRGFNINILQDNDFDCDILFGDFNLGKIIGFSKNYSIGEKHNYKTRDFESWEDMKNVLIKDFDALHVFPLYMYDHSNISLSISPFGCRFDSGQMGFVVITKDDFNNFYNCLDVSKNKIEEDLKLHLDRYSDVLNGDVYSYWVDEIWDAQLFGFVGYDHEKSGLFSSAKSDIDRYIKNKNIERINKLKDLIKHNVPLNLRHGLLA